MTLSAVAEATGLARATARRSLLTLVELGYAEADGRAFRPLPRVLELGYAPSRSSASPTSPSRTCANWSAPSMSRRPWPYSTAATSATSRASPPSAS
ncbi:helix-turn-helix domain-containing protein [Streptomyces indonesiensis]